MEEKSSQNEEFKFEFKIAVTMMSKLSMWKKIALNEEFKFEFKITVTMVDKRDYMKILDANRYKQLEIRYICVKIIQFDLLVVVVYK